MRGAEAWFKEVRDSGKPKELEPMNPADRRAVHKAAEEYGLSSESVGQGYDRHIMLKPAVPEPVEPKKETKKKSKKEPEEE